MPNIRTMLHDGLVIRSDQNLGAWKRDLVARVHAHFGGPGDFFTADLVGVDALFDTDKRSARRDAINRTYEVPVEVDDLVYAIEVDPPGDMYQKTRHLVARRGSLGVSAPRPAGVPARAAAAPQGPPDRVDERVVEIVTRRVLDSIEMIYGTRPPEPGEAAGAVRALLDEALKPVRRRVLMVEKSHERLVEAVRKDAIGTYEPFFVEGAE